MLRLMAMLRRRHTVYRQHPDVSEIRKPRAVHCQIIRIFSGKTASHRRSTAMSHYPPARTSKPNSRSWTPARLLCPCRRSTTARRAMSTSSSWWCTRCIRDVTLATTRSNVTRAVLWRAINTSSRRTWFAATTVGGSTCPDDFSAETIRKPYWWQSTSLFTVFYGAVFRVVMLSVYKLNGTHFWSYIVCNKQNLLIFLCQCSSVVIIIIIIIFYQWLSICLIRATPISSNVIFHHSHARLELRLARWRSID